MNGLYETIAAVSTPRGKGGVALIRISGPDALSVGDAVFSKKLSGTEANRAVYGQIYFPMPGGVRECIDDGIATVFKAPNSFTGEDTVELSCHGGMLITERVLAACFAAGARQAEAGEFTRRAYVNGKIRLDSAEALGALLEAKTMPQLALARSGMSGRLAKQADALYEELLTVAAELRADIDFPDEDVSEMTDVELYEKLSHVEEEIRRLAGTYTTGRAVADGVRTVICGRTNSGKSSLYNRIVGYDAAIVTDIEGTTRDLISDTVSFGGITLRLCDTAGIRDSLDPVEQIGIDRAKDALASAELIFAVVDRSQTLKGSDLDLMKKISESSGYKIAIINKTDLPAAEQTLDFTRDFDATVSISAKTGEGICDLSQIVSKAFLNGDVDLSTDAVVSTARQYGALVSAEKLLSSALKGIDDGLPCDLVCVDVEGALSELASIGGRESGEDMISAIFSKFCVGK